MEIVCPWDRFSRSQQEFIGDHRAPFILYSAGFGTGKTTADAVKICDLSARNPGVPGMIAAQSWSAVEGTLLQELRTLLHLDLPVRGKERSFSLDGQTPIFVGTYDGYQYSDGRTVGWVVMDEVRHCTRPAWVVFMTRARIPCPAHQTALSSTPIGGFMRDEFGQGRDDRRVIFGSTRENAHNLAPGYIENLESSWSSRMRSAALDGQFVLLEGAVFEAFDDRPTSPWVIDYDEAKWAKQPCELWIDPGYRRSAVLWVREHPTEPLTWVVFDQQMPEGQPMTRTVQTINALAKKHKRIIGDVVVDPAAAQSDQASELTMRRVLREGLVHSGEIRVPSGFYRGIEWGIERLRATLGDPEIGLPRRLYFSRELAASEASPSMGGRGIMRSLAGLKYKEMRDGHHVSETPAEDPLFEHAVDACRYGVVLKWLRNPGLRKMLHETGTEGAGHAAL